MNKLRACFRLSSALAHILVGLLTILLRFPSFSDAERQRRVQVWSATMLRRLGITLRVVGQPALAGPVLLVSNHISWLDITSLHAARFCRFVSKADVKQWPVIGALASGVGTLFIERESRRDAMRVVHHMAERLSGGDVLAVFPEGTTSDGLSLLPFHANLIQSAIAANAAVQPIGLRFEDIASGQTSLAPCYINDDTLLGSCWRTLCTPGIAVVITFGELQTAQGRDRRTWAAELRDEVMRLRS
jgi:1-acyl-sn-glycerol-3-phosphate acyltransferase